MPIRTIRGSAPGLEDKTILLFLEFRQSDPIANKLNFCGILSKFPGFIFKSKETC